MKILQKVGSRCSPDFHWENWLQKKKKFHRPALATEKNVFLFPWIAYYRIVYYCVNLFPNSFVNSCLPGFLPTGHFPLFRIKEGVSLYTVLISEKYYCFPYLHVTICVQPTRLHLWIVRNKIILNTSTLFQSEVLLFISIIEYEGPAARTAIQGIFKSDIIYLGGAKSKTKSPGESSVWNDQEPSSVLGLTRIPERKNLPSEIGSFIHNFCPPFSPG